MSAEAGVNTANTSKIAAGCLLPICPLLWHMQEDDLGDDAGETGGAEGMDEDEDDDQDGGAEARPSTRRSRRQLRRQQEEDEEEERCEGGGWATRLSTCQGQALHEGD